MIFVALILLIVVLAGLRIVAQYQRAVVFRLGKFQSIRNPGLTWIIPLIDVARLVDVRVVTLTVEPQETMTKDNVPVKVRAVVWYRVTQPKDALIEVESYGAAVTQTSLTALRMVMGKHTLDELLKEQAMLSVSLKETIDKVTEPWGVAVERVELKDVEIPQTMQRAMAQEAEALREKRARIIKADAEFEAAVKLRQAADEISRSGAALELRRMQMLTEIGAEQNTMTVVMLPSEFVTAAGALAKMAAARAPAAPDAGAPPPLSAG
ncbi:MAG TPA: SPFH domain-containing protein [Burkholderiaceae bacterium]|nr:SPFH domain-containing protein [Burkholderiaceae bacterium]